MSGQGGRPAALVTGAAVRLGAAITNQLHAHGYNVVIHCRRSRRDADSLSDSLNQMRPDSARVITADLRDPDQARLLGEQAVAVWNRLDVLVNNASAFYPVALGQVSDTQWDEFTGVNARAPLFLSQACRHALAENGGCIINISDLYASRGLANHVIYCMSKGALEAMTRALARELAPAIRVNAIAPGAILWPADKDLPDDKKQVIIDKCALKRMGAPADIANAVRFLVEQGTYITGQVIHVDGGR